MKRTIRGSLWCVVLFLLPVVLACCITAEPGEFPTVSTARETDATNALVPTEVADPSDDPMTDDTDSPVLPPLPPQTTERATATETEPTTVEPTVETTTEPIETGFPNVAETDGTKYY